MSHTMKVTIAAIAIGALGSAAWVHNRADAHGVPSYRLATVERGTIRATVSATGALSAVRTVEVGTQVSGQIAAIYVDFNAHVTKGQLIARIDPVLQEQAVQDAQAGVARAQAPLTQTKLEIERSKTLHDQKIVTDVEFNTAQSNYEVAKANLSSAQISLDRARQNLAYTNIYSPIDGVVVERAMDVGQTVAASLSAPKLFVIANDLSQMQILASVDESDIGKISSGQHVTFSVQSYAKQEFTGTVKQVRLNSTTVNNVVSYSAVISVVNPDGKLLPGMTATVKFVTGQAENVLTVPAAALRFAPAQGAATAATSASNAQGGQPGGQQGGPQGGAGGMQGGAGGPQGGPPAGMPSGGGDRPAGERPAGGRMSGGGSAVWTVDADGKLTRHAVRAGLSDGQRTQIEGNGIDAGSSVILSANVPGATTQAQASTNPLQQNNQRGGRGGPPGPF